MADTTDALVCPEADGSAVAAPHPPCRRCKTVTASQWRGPGGAWCSRSKCKEEAARAFEALKGDAKDRRILELELEVIELKRLLAEAVRVAKGGGRLGGAEPAAAPQPAPLAGSQASVALVAHQRVSHEPTNPTQAARPAPAPTRALAVAPQPPVRVEAPPGAGQKRPALAERTNASVPPVPPKKPCAPPQMIPRAEPAACASAAAVSVAKLPAGWTTRWSTTNAARVWEYHELDLQLFEPPRAHDAEKACLVVQPELVMELRRAALYRDPLVPVRDCVLRGLFEKCMGLPGNAVQGSAAHFAVWKAAVAQALKLWREKQAMKQAHKQKEAPVPRAACEVSVSAAVLDSFLDGM